MPRSKWCVLALVAWIGSAAADPPTIAELIARLGSKAFAEREDASRQLAERGDEAYAALEACTTSADPEVSTRAKNLRAEIVRRRDVADLARTEREREANLTAYEALGPALAAEHKDRWVAIAGGKLVATAATEDELWAALDLAGGPMPAHRFVFRAGTEKVTGERRGHGSLRSGDLGMGLDLGFNIVSSGDELFRSNDKGPRFGELVPLTAMDLAARGGGSHRLEKLFYNTGMVDALCLEPAVARVLGLHRAELPGVIEGATITPAARPGTMLDYPARRAWVRVRCDGMKGPMWVVAIIPREIPR